MLDQLPADVPAEIAGGRYRVKSFLGEGGRKRVYLADDTQASRQVAVALFDTKDVAAAVQARARREAQAMRKLGDHPHVVSVVDTGEEGGNPFIVSEYMAGGDIEGLLASEGGKLGVERAVEVAADVTRALEHAHARGIVHRDLKPANVWLDDDGAARLGDFGLATTEGRARVSGGNLVGTVAYLPPEQALGEAAGPESDLYSLGALLYEMLTGQPPFSGDDAVSIISQHLHSDPVPPSRLNPEVPEPLDRAVLELLAKRGEDRPDGAAAARDGLKAALAAPEASLSARVDNPLDRLAGGVFVGRDVEIEQMREAVDSAQAGSGGVQLLVGEPGIGKTRAAEELATYARVHGARVYWGRCREDDGAPAYWPWVQAIRELVRDSDPVAMAWQMGASAADIAQLVPEVAERLDVEPTGPSDSEEARFRLFDSITRFLVAASRDRPMVIVVDDLHWADEPSLLLLKYAAAEIASSGLLIVGTYRDVELGRQHPLARVLGELGGNRISLRGLDTDDVSRYIEMTAGAPAAPVLVEAVHAQTDGNPFFVGEVVRLLASEGRLADLDRASREPEIPQGVREVVGRRLDRLSQQANEALRVAAAIGREFEDHLVLQVAELEFDQLVKAANEAVRERLVTDLGGGRYSFAHALVRDTLYDELSAAQRAALHERIANALEEACREDDSERLGELAHHFLAAAPRGDLAKAIDYAERAGEQDMEQLAYEDAAEVFGRALEVLELTDEPDEARRLRLLLALGGAEASASRVSDARRAFGRAADSARALGDTDRLIGAAIGIALLSTTGKVDERLVELIDEALEAIGEEQSARRAALLSAKSQELYWVDAQKLSKPLVEEALAIAREIDAPTTLATALHRQIFIPIGPDAPHERLRIAQEMLELGRSSGDREAELRAHAYRVQNLLELGDLAAADREIEIYATLAEELRMPQHIWHTDALRGMRAILDGEIGEAERLAEQTRRAGERAEQPLAAQYYGVQIVQIRSLQGRASELLPAVRDLAARFPAIPAWRTALISLAARAGEIETGRLELDRFAGDGLSVIPLDANWLPAMGLIGESAALLGDVERSRAIYEELLPYAGRVIVVARAAACNGPVDRVLGLLAQTSGRRDRAVQHLGDAIEISKRIGDRPGMTLSRVELAEVLLDRDGRGDRERALELLGDALPLAQGMGARWIVDRALRLRLDAQGLSGIDVTTSIDDVVSALESERPDLRALAAPDGTVAILFSDIEDSTVLTERLGDERWLEVLRSHNNVFRDEIARHDGYEVKSQGDGFMLTFPDPCDALDCAIAVQRAFVERERVDSEESLRVRMGLHTGEVIAEEGDFFGKNVILAARIAGQALGGEILVSEQMREAAGSSDGIGFDEGRDLELKGLAGTHRVYRAEWDSSIAPA
ncbi:MAG: protein kinase [Actinomycetota bacterium]|nr:protein kinase [Actinomycetota bacterium]